MPVLPLVDEDRVRLEDALVFGVFNHGQGDPVFDAAGGIQVFQFNEKAGCQMVAVVEADRFQKGRMTDEAGHASVHFFHSIMFSF